MRSWQLGMCKMQKEKVNDAEAGLSAALQTGDAALDETDPEVG